MKRFILLLACFVIPVAVFGQEGDTPAGTLQLPFSRLINMTPAELVKARFRYEVELNRYIMRKSDFWGTMEERPKRKNYKVVVQFAAKEPAYVHVSFTNPEAYHRIMEYLFENGMDYKETVSTRMVNIIFEYDGMSCTLRREPKYKATTYSSENGVYSSTRDISHENFTFIIDTGREPHSLWHDKQRKKQERRTQRNARPRTILELM